MRYIQLLRKADKHPVMQFEMDDWIEETDKSAISGNLFDIEDCEYSLEDWDSEKKFIVSCYFKWDGCSHWHFLGEDYDYSEQNKKTIDGYYHLCGGNRIRLFMTGIAFICEIMEKTSSHFDPGMADAELTKDIRELLLKDYEVGEWQEI